MKITLKLQKCLCVPIAKHKHCGGGFASICFQHGVSWCDMSCEWDSSGRLKGFFWSLRVIFLKMIDLQHYTFYSAYTLTVISTYFSFYPLALLHQALRHILPRYYSKSSILLLLEVSWPSQRGVGYYNVIFLTLVFSCYTRMSYSLVIVVVHYADSRFRVVWIVIVCLD
jgi:hypothetical protein